MGRRKERPVKVYRRNARIAFYIASMGDFTSGVRLGGNLLRMFWSVRNSVGVVTFIYPYLEYVQGETDEVLAVQ